MSTPLVSIVIAAYQTDPAHLLTALDSALAQTWADIEVMIADDSPTDSLRTVVGSRGDPRIHYCHHSPSLGAASNHWHAFSNARGEFIAVLNHDDYLEPEFVSTLVSELQCEADAVLAFCDHWIINGSGSIETVETERASLVYGRKKLPPGMHRPFCDLVIAQTIPMAMGSVFRRSALPVELPDYVGPAYDLWLTYLLARTGSGACYVPQRLSAWRSHGTNLTSAGSVAWLNGSAYCWQAMASDRAFAAQRTAAKRKAAIALVACGLHSWRNGRRLACISYAAQSLKMQISLRGLALMLLLPLFPARLASELPALRPKVFATSHNV